MIVLPLSWAVIPRLTRFGVHRPPGEDPRFGPKFFSDKLWHSVSSEPTFGFTAGELSRNPHGGRPRGVSLVSLGTIVIKSR